MSDVRAAALKLHAEGFDPIPLHPGEKRPMHGNWQRLVNLSPERVAALFEAPGCGVGIVTGRGLLVIDVDGQEGSDSLAALEKDLGWLPPTRGVLTASGGRHLYFRVPADSSLKNTASTLAPKVDTRAEGGQVVAPPTVLADGRTYSWLNSMEVAALPVKWLLRLLGAGKKVEAPEEPGVEVLVPARTRESALALARSYAAKMEPAVAGQGGHGATFRAACRIVERVTCQEDAMLVLREYNARCSPPWTDEELLHKLEGALSKVRFAPRAEGDAPAPQAPSVAGPVDLEALDYIDTQKDNADYWRARQEFVEDGGVIPEGATDEQVCALLRETTRLVPRGPGRPGKYLKQDYWLLDWAGQRPSHAAHVEAPNRNWVRYLPASDAWTGFISSDSMRHFLTNAGLNKRSVDEFMRRAPHTVDTKMVYTTSDRLALDQGAIVINTYRPATLKPEAGDWSAIRTVLLNLVNGDESHLEWFLDWCGWWVQRARAGKPEKTGVAVVFYGAHQGAGKGVITEHVLPALVGKGNYEVVGQPQLDEPFNGWADGRLLIVANECFSSDNRTQSTSNKLKPLITDSEIQVRRMYSMPVRRENVANVIFTSNDDRPVKVEGLDRRYTIFRVAGAIDPKLGEAVARDADEGGPMTRALLADLLARPCTTFVKMTPLQTEAKAEVQYDTAQSADKFIADLNTHGWDLVAEEYVRTHGSNDILIRQGDEVWVPSATLYSIYRSYSDSRGYGHVGESVLSRAISRQPWVKRALVKWKGKPHRCVGGMPALGVEAPVEPNEADLHPNVQRFITIMGGNQ